MNDVRGTDKTDGHLDRKNFLGIYYFRIQIQILIGFFFLFYFRNQLQNNNSISVAMGNKIMNINDMWKKQTKVQDKQQDIMLPAHDIIKPFYKCSICLKQFDSYKGQKGCRVSNKYKIKFLTLWEGKYLSLIHI